MPSWRALQMGARPDVSTVVEPGDWPHGWQYFASSTREHHFRKNEIIATSSTADRAHLRSRSGAGSSSVLLGCPTAPEFVLQPFDFRILLLDRLRLPLPIMEQRCEGCGKLLDAQGRHRTSCMLTGRIRRRAGPVEVTTARICREAGAVPRDGKSAMARSAACTRGCRM